jgi:beta-carotene ketolase (CrtW type)
MGILIASTVIGLWVGHLIWVFSLPTLNFASPMLYFHIIIQSYLYTGLFITAHDSMHGGVSKNRNINTLFGQIALWLFAAFPYQKMFTKHMAHHHFVGTEKDPDFSNHQNLFYWFITFFFSYVTVLQIITMALLFNIGHYLVGISVLHLVLFWVIPAFLGTFQLFYFGTYRPHRLPHTPEMAPHKSRTQKRNHLWAMLTCWFFGYHYEHHEYPRTPWWQLYRKKNTS